MKDSGRTGNKVATDDGFMQMDKSTRVKWKMVKLMVTGLTNNLMELPTRVSGRMISNTVKELKLVHEDLVILGNTETG